MTTTRVDVEELRPLFLFEELREEQLEWLAERSQIRAYDTGAVVYREGEPSEALWVLLDGGVRLSRTVVGEDVVLNETTQPGAYAGAVRAFVTGRDPTYQTSLATTVPSRLLRLPAADFATFVREGCPMAVHLLDGLYVGIRNSEATLRQREHLAQLGTLSANLAHELNNPAAAAVRATEQLRSRVAGMRHKLGLLAEGGIDPVLIARMVQVQDAAVERAAKRRPALTALEETDLEDALADRLTDRGVTGAYDLAPVFAAAGMDPQWVDDVADEVGAGSVDPAFRWLAYTLETEALLDELEDTSTRIFTLVGAVKQYSRVDDAGHRESDLHAGLDSTAVMLGHKLSGVVVRRSYDRSLPPVPGYAAELNQVWTNLIDNAVDAMGGRGTLELRTRRDGDAAVVEVADDGPGIPEEVRDRLFEPFVTTKAVGEGSGLGLDNARRIVERRHLGSLTYSTGPDGTTFTVRLPLRPLVAAAPVHDA
jgi:signal transduction histidine kinase